MAADYNFFYEDEVYRINKKGNIEFGMVLENAELADSDESSDVEESEKIKRGHLRVAWHPKGEEEIVQEKKVKLSDRSLMPGDVVRRMIKGKDTQRGYCRNVQVTATVQIVGTKQVVYNVNSQDLIPLEEFSSDIAVCMDSWVGMVKMVQSKIYLRTEDGSRCVLDDEDALDLDDLRERRDRDSEFHRYDFYPGQVLCGPLHCFDSAEWTVASKEVTSLKHKPQKNIKVTVEDVKVISLGVHWQCWAYSKDGGDANKEQPKYLVQGKNIKKVKLLNVFEPCTLQVGDRNYYVFKEDDILMGKDEWQKLERGSRYAGKENGTIPGKVSKKDKDADGVSTNVEVEVTDGHCSESSDQYEDIETDDGSMSDTASISSSCSASSQGGWVIAGKKGKKGGPTLVTRWLKKKYLKKAKRRMPTEIISVKAGDRLVLETLTTLSKADVVWQDGTVEEGIPSIELYPIHHLDDQEFFPGDFVIENKEDASTRMYGVVQRVDHAGRTAMVKWFRTYTSLDDPKPSFLQENEVSVYDLKDHPDFQYRPGTVVIRVANFEGEDANCTAGQVLDNYPCGQVKVWWVDNHTSMSWPQDLYKVGEYDSDEGELWDDDNSDGSWETESEHSFIDDAGVQDDQVLRPKLAANIEKARIAMARLEEIFTQNPSLQTTVVMRQLLEVYKDCRCLDKLMGTTFFHESNFQGLLARVREKGRASTAQRVAEQVSRLFHVEQHSHNEVPPAEGDGGDSGIQSNKGSTEDSLSSGGDLMLTENIANLESHLVSEVAAANGKVKQQPKGGGSVGGVSSTTGRKEGMEGATSTQVCARLCSLIKAQLVKAHGEVTRLFGSGQQPPSAVFLDEADESPLVVENQTVTSGDKDEASVEMSAKESNTASQEVTSADAEDAPCDSLPESTAAENEDGPSEVAALDNPLVPTDTGEGFAMLESAPDDHKYKLTMFQPTDAKAFFKAVRQEMKLLKYSLPPGIWVKGYEDRMDLYSVMIRGPAKTPYEDGLFLFDFQLSADYPKSPPVCHYLSYCSDRLNPNLYEDGKVCVSLLGTWSGKGTEVWTADSNLLQVIVSIQGLILVSEPYFNEAGYEKQKGSQQGKENSRMYNEMVVLKLVQATTKMLQQPPLWFADEIWSHFRTQAPVFVGRLQKWLEVSEHVNSVDMQAPPTPTSFKEMVTSVKSDEIQLPDYPLIPASKGFCLSLKKALVSFQETLTNCGVPEASKSS